MHVNASRRLSDEAYVEFCLADPGIPYERTAEGEIIVAPQGVLLGVASWFRR